MSTSVAQYTELYGAPWVNMTIELSTVDGEYLATLRVHDTAADPAEVARNRLKRDGLKAVLWKLIGGREPTSSEVADRIIQGQEPLEALMPVYDTCALGSVWSDSARAEHRDSDYWEGAQC